MNFSFSSKVVFNLNLTRKNIFFFFFFTIEREFLVKTRMQEFISFRWFRGSIKRTLFSGLKENFG